MDVLKDVLSRDDVAMDDLRWQCLLLSRLRAWAELVDVQEGLTWALNKDRRSHNAAVVEEER
jgi:hypothetical protein